MNAVAFYVLKGKLLVTLGETENGDTKVVTIKNVDPIAVPAALDSAFGFDFRTLSLVMSSSDDYSHLFGENPKSGPSFIFMPELNTMP